MITGWAGTDNELDGLAAGVNAYLIKPFRPAELRELVKQLCPEVTAEESTVPLRRDVSKD